jgi:hypothetical protein
MRRLNARIYINMPVLRYSGLLGGTVYTVVACEARTLEKT